MRKGFVKQQSFISSRDCSDVGFKEKGDFCKECKKIMKNAMDIRIYSSETLAEEFDRNCKFFMIDIIFTRDFLLFEHQKI